MVRYRSNGGANRIWTVDNYGDMVNMPAAAYLRNGDKLYMAYEDCWLTRRGGKWRPDEPDLWGANDATAVPFGTLSSEGVWTVTAGTHNTIGTAYANKFIDVLALIIGNGAEIMALNKADRTGAPRFLGIRGVYLSKGTSAMTIGTYQSGTAATGGEGVDGGEASISGSTANGAHSRFDALGGFVCASGGIGGNNGGAQKGGSFIPDPGLLGVSGPSSPGNLMAWGDFGRTSIIMY